MRFNILKKVNGSGSTAPKNKFAYLAHINDIQSFPKADHKGVALVDDIVMKEKTGMAQIYITPAAQEYSYETVGDSDSKSFKLKFLGTHPGTELEALEFVKNYLEEDFVILIPSCEIGLKVLGTPDAPLRFTSSHKSDKDSQKFIFTFEQEIGTENVYQLYTGLVTLNENIDVDMGDFLEALKSYMKLDGSNLSEVQKQNLRTILGSDGKNLGNSDLSLEQNRSFNLGAYFLNFFSNVGAKIGINKNNPTQALDVVGNIKTDGLIISEGGNPDEVGSIKRSEDEIKFKTSEGWETVMLKGDYVSDSNGIIYPDTPEPASGWKIGWYTPKVKSDFPGTNYPNQNNLKVIDGVFTEFYFDGISWDAVLVGESRTSTELVNFSENIYFDKQSISVATVSGPIAFKPIGANAKLLGSTLVRLTADGINMPDFSKFRKFSGSEDYDNTQGVLNSIYFFYDGFDAWMNMWQGIGSSDIDFSDVTPPTAPTIQITDTQDKNVSLSWSGATDNIAVTSYEIFVNGILKNTVSGSPFTVTNLNPSTLYEFKIKAKDAAGNSSGFSNAVSTTTLSPQNTPIIFNSLSSGATFTNNTLQGNSGSGGIVTPYNSTLDGFELILGDSSDIAVLSLHMNDSGVYDFGNSANLNGIILAIFRTNGTIQIVQTGGALLYTHSGNEAFARIKRVGNDAVMSVSANGSSWTDVYTKTNGFLGYNTAYIKGVFAGGTNVFLKAYLKN